MKKKKRNKNKYCCIDETFIIFKIHVFTLVLMLFVDRLKEICGKEVVRQFSTYSGEDIELGGNHLP